MILHIFTHDIHAWTETLVGAVLPQDLADDLEHNFGSGGWNSCCLFLIDADKNLDGIILLHLSQSESLGFSTTQTKQ